jgi:hypothetical protein
MVEFFSAGFFSLTNPTLTVGLWAGLVVFIGLWIFGSTEMIKSVFCDSVANSQSHGWFLARFSYWVALGWAAGIYWAIYIIALDTWVRGGVRRVRRYLSEPVGGKKRPPQVS